MGLDSFTLFDILNATGSSTFGNSVKLQKMGVAKTSKEERVLLKRGLNANKVENISVSLTLKDVSINALLLMALDQNLMGQLKIGSIMNTKNIIPCLLSTIHSVGLSEFVMDVGDISELRIAGFISDSTSRSIQSLTDAIFAKYKQTVRDAIPAFTSITIRPILHDIMQVLVDRARNGAFPHPLVL